MPAEKVRVDSPAAGPQRPTTNSRSVRAVVAATIGNMFEAYDFAVYAFFAVIISRLFFPSGDETASLLLAVGTFGVSFVMRPVGAVVLGTLADRKGRKVALSVTIMAMAVGTAMIGLAPTYAMVGAWAPAIIVLARLIQGFSAGGEFGAATAFLVEHASPGRRGFFASWQQAGQVCALLTGSLMGVALTGLMSPGDLASWGWRVPFLAGLLIGPVGLYIRSRTDEPVEFEHAARQQSGSRLGLVLRGHWRGVLAGFGITITWTVCTYFFLVYMPTYAVRELRIPQFGSFLANSASLVVLLVLVPVFGALSDRIGRRNLLLGSASAIVLLTYPSLALVAEKPSTVSLLLLQVCFAVILATFTGVAPAAMAEVCPPGVRSTSVSIAYSFAVAIFGGFAPFTATWLIADTGNTLSPAWYVMASCCLSGLLIFFLYRKRLIQD
jgi:MFS transporter, MHS family, proline/betaine transporter